MQAIGFLLMLFTILAVPAGLGLLFYAWRTGRPRLVRGVALFGLGWAALYGVLLVATALLSHEVVLGLGERKAFCGFYLDCHLGVAVEDVQQTPALGDGPARRAASGVFYLVTIRVTSDAQRATLPLVNPRAVLLDRAGHRYERVPAAEELVAPGSAFARAVVAGEGFTKTLVFEAPAEASGLRLLVTKGEPMERLSELFLLGDEDSLWHRKTLLAV